MLTVNQTQLHDNQIIWVVKVTLDTATLYFSTTKNSITLSGTLFDGRVIFDDSSNNLSDITKSIDVSQGGSIGQVGNFNFSLARYVTYTGVSNFMNDFYPETNKPLLTSRTVNVGWVYEGATTLSEITWFSESYIEDPQYDNNKINLGCIEYDELVEVTLPHYTIQKDFNNGISYFANCPDESVNQVIPIIYGSMYNEGSLLYGYYLMNPAIRTDKLDNNYIVCSHLVKTSPVGTMLYKYLEQPDTMMGMVGSGGTGISKTRRGLTISLSADGSIIYGFVKLRFKKIINSGYFNYYGAELIDDDPDTATENVKGMSIGLQLGYSMTPSEFGELFCNATDISFYVSARSKDTNSQTVELGVYHSLTGADNDPSGYAYTGNKSVNASTGAKSLISADIGALLTPTPFTIEDMQSAYFTIKPAVGNSANTNIYNAYLEFSNVRIYDQRKFAKVNTTKMNIRLIRLGGMGV